MGCRGEDVGGPETKSHARVRESLGDAEGSGKGHTMSAYGARVFCEDNSMGSVVVGGGIEPGRRYR